MIHVKEATHPRSSKNPVKMFPSFSFRPGFLFDLLAPWLPSSSGVIARSSPARHSLGGAKGVSLYRRSVGLSDWKKGRGELFDVVFPLDFGRSDLALEA